MNDDINEEIIALIRYASQDYESDENLKQQLNDIFSRHGYVD